MDQEVRSGSGGRADSKKAQIAAAVIAVAADGGLARLTHRRVAERAGVSLAATTYYYADKDAMVAEAAAWLAADQTGQLRALIDQSLVEQGRAGQAISQNAVATSLLCNSVGPSHLQALAWCELLLGCARSSEGRARARAWYAEQDELWAKLGLAAEVRKESERPQLLPELITGMLFILLALGLDQRAAKRLMQGDDPVQVLGPSTVALNPAAEARKPAKAAATRDSILQGAISVLVDAGAGAVTYGAVSQASGVARTAPAYHFGSIAELLVSSQAELFDQSKTRFREAFAMGGWDDLSPELLADVTTAIFVREATEFGKASIAHYSVWLEAARSSALRAEVAAAVLDQVAGWSRRLRQIGEVRPAKALACQALFIGLLVRALATGCPVDLLATVPRRFRQLLRDGEGMWYDRSNQVDGGHAGRLPEKEN